MQIHDKKFLVEKYQAEELHRLLAVLQNPRLESGVLQGFEDINAAGLHGRSHDLFIAASHAIQVEDRLVLPVHLFDHACIAESAGHSIHPECLIAPGQKGNSLQLSHGLLHLDRRIGEGTTGVFGRNPAIRLGLKANKNRISVCG